MSRPPGSWTIDRSQLIPCLLFVLGTYGLAACAGGEPMAGVEVERETIGVVCLSSTVSPPRCDITMRTVRTPANSGVSLSAHSGSEVRGTARGELDETYVVRYRLGARLRD